jgi:hypothetical protein
MCSLTGFDQSRELFFSDLSYFDQYIQAKEKIFSFQFSKSTQKSLFLINLNKQRFAFKVFDRLGCEIV